MPRGPRRNLRPVAESMSQPISPTSTGIWPTDWQASSSSGTPAARAERADRGGGVDEAALRRDVDERDELDALVEHRRERADVDLAVLVVGHDDDRGAGAVGDLAQRDVVARVLRVRGEDAVAGLELERVEGHVPRARGVLDDRDLVALAADQPRDRVVAVLDAVLALGLRLVAADRRLAAQVLDHRLEHRLGRERGAGVVEVGDLLDAGRVGAGAGDVDAIVSPACAPRSSGCRRPAGAAAARAARGRRAAARDSRGTRTGTTATGCRRGARSPRACG